MPTEDDRENEDLEDEDEDRPARVHPRPEGAPAGRPRSGAAAARRTGVGSPDYDGWSNREADLMWGEMLGTENKKCLKKLGHSAYDIVLRVMRIDAPGKPGINLGVIEGSSCMGSQSVSPGEQLVKAVTDGYHLPISDGPALYDVHFLWKKDNRIYGRGALYLPSSGEIVAMRQAQAQQRAAQAVPQQNYPAAGMGAPPQPPPQQPYYPPPQQPQYALQGYAPQAPPPQYGTQYRPQEPAPAPAAPAARPNDPEVSALRAEVGELRGSVRELVDVFKKGFAQREAPAAAAPPQAPPVGIGAPAYPRPERERERERDEDDELDEMRSEMRSEMSDLRDSVNEIGAMLRRGFGAPPAAAPAPVQATAPAPAQQVAPARAAAAVPTQEPDLEERIAQRILRSLGVSGAGLGAAPVAAPPTDPAQQMAIAIAGLGAMAEQVKAFKKVSSQLSTMFEPASAPADADDAHDPDPEPTPPPPPELPFDVIRVPETSLFGHPAQYTPNRKTGKIDWEGALFSNPGVMEKFGELATEAVGALSTFAKRATQSAVTGGPRTPPQVHAAPAQTQVVDNIPAGATDATVGVGAANGAAPQNGAAGSPWPQV